MAKSKLAPIGKETVVVKVDAKDSQALMLDDCTISWADIKQTIAVGATDTELVMFMNICQSHQLNPFKREIYFVKYGAAKASFIVGYEVYLKRAEATGQLDGWSVAVTDDKQKAIVTIHRKDRSKAVVWEVDRAEFDSGKSTWAKMPMFMLKKVAIAQGFRLAFPEVVGGLPYTKEEQETISGDIVRLPEVTAPIPVAAAELTTTAKEESGITSQQAEAEVDQKLESGAPTEEKSEPVAKPQESDGTKVEAKEPAAGPDGAGEQAIVIPNPDEAAEPKLDEGSIGKIYDAFKKWDITTEHLEAYTGKPVAEWTAKTKTYLADVYVALDDGTMKPAEVSDPDMK